MKIITHKIWITVHKILKQRTVDKLRLEKNVFKQHSNSEG